jgi:septal ring factor EnvC (AmiA/AmiB activator)
VSGAVTPANLAAMVSLFDRVLALLSSRPEVAPREIDAEVIRIDTATRSFEQFRAEHLQKYHLVEVRLERLRHEEAAARRAVDRARGAELRRLRERELREVQDEIEHLTHLHARMEHVRAQVNETAAVVRRGHLQLRRLRDTIAVEREAAAAAEARAAACAQLQRSRDELRAIRDDVDRRAAQALGAGELTMDDPFVTGLILEEADDRHFENRPPLEG